MSYLKSMATSFVYIAFFLAVITFSPGLPPTSEFSEYSIKSPVKLEGVLAPNERLNDAELLFEGEIKGPECFDSYNGELYTGMHGGNVGKIVGNKIIPVVKFGKKCSGTWEEKECGRPLGLKFDKQGRLYVADTYYGIFKVDVKTGKYEKLFDPSQPIDGKVPILINSVDIAKNGDVYWTESSSEFTIQDGAFVMLANPSGRLIRYNAATKKNEVLSKKLAFANGLKLSDDESYVIVAETMTSVIRKYHLKGPKTGKIEILIEGLPGLPDNIHSDGQGNYLVALVLPADPQHPQFTQTLIPHPYIRKMLARLLGLAEMPFKLLDDVYPNDFAKKVVHALGSFETMNFIFPQKVTVLRIDGNGKILDALHNSDEKVAGMSSAFIHDNYLWLGSPFNEYLARVPLKQAFPNSVFSQVKEEPRVTREAPQVEKPVAAAPKVEKTTTAKPTRKTTSPPTPTEAPKAPKPEKIEKPKPKEAQKEPERKQQVPKNVEIPKPPKKEIPVRENEIPKPTKQAGSEKPAKKVVTESEWTDELPRPIKQAGSTKPTKQAEPPKPKQPEAAKPPKKPEPTKHSTKIADEI